MQDTCGAKTRKGEPCKNNPMQNGRCRMHGGLSPKGIESPHYNHGRYSKYAPESLQGKIADLGEYNLLDLADELQTQRALISEYIDRYKDGAKLSEQSMGMIISWLNSVGIMVERMMKIRNETALTGAEIAYLQMRTADLVVKYIDDPEKRRAFVIELFELDKPKQLV